jgi:hypothetical protein
MGIFSKCAEPPGFVEPLTKTLRASGTEHREECAGCTNATCRVCWGTSELTDAGTTTFGDLLFLP